MNNDNYVITKNELLNYERGRKIKKINKIWLKVISKLPNKLRHEAEHNGFKLELCESDSLFKILRICSLNSTEELDEALTSAYPFIFCFQK
jgi:hypothetical protein